jgi:hypothetical protein
LISASIALICASKLSTSASGRRDNWRRRGDP